MRLLIITQLVSRTDPALGFFHRWIEEFAAQCDEVSVICLAEGEHALPANVHVRSLGKESGAPRMVLLTRLYRYLVDPRTQYDIVFVHMSPIYVLLGFLFWKLRRIPVTLWYTHGHVDLKLRTAVQLADRIYTASPDSMRISTPKRKVVGHGIDLSQFAPRPGGRTPATRHILSVGRIARVKNLGVLIEALPLLLERIPDARLTVAGAPITTQDEAYKAELVAQVDRLGLRNRVVFAGPLAPAEVPQLLASADAFVNLSDTGSIDKAVLEALASEVPVVTSNQAFAKIIPSSIVALAPGSVAEGIERALREPAVGLREVALRYSLERLIERILMDMRSLCAR